MRATWHPRVPAPKRRHFMVDKIFRFRDGKARHRISFKFKSAADIANLQTLSENAEVQKCINAITDHGIKSLITYLVGSMDLARLIHLYTFFPLLSSHPTTLGTCSSSLHSKRTLFTNLAK